MTSDDVDLVDTNPEYDDGHDVRPSRRSRLKDALNRTKTKISKAKEGREVKRLQQQQEKASYTLDDDVNDFLAAGRSSFASSQRPSIASGPSEARVSADTASSSPRPSTSDSQTHPSPRRGPPIPVPRIDVSASTRFPNARDVDPDALIFADSGDLSSSHPPPTSLLKPEYKIRSQSSTSIAFNSRKARIRGLSVGFADSPPVIIGEGGDEAQAPAIEISRAKARARSASPQGRKLYASASASASANANANAQPDATRQIPGSGMNDNAAESFVPKPFTRVQTGRGLPGTPTSALPGPQADDFKPKPLVGMQTGKMVDDFVPQPFARIQTGFSDSRASPHPVRSAPTMPMPLPHRETGPPVRQLPPIQASGLDMTKEFEMTLGLGSATDSHAAAKPQTQIVAPKPKRAPPSYDLIEAAGRPPGDIPPQQTPPPAPHQHVPTQGPLPQAAHPPSAPYTIENVQRRPVPPPQPRMQPPSSDPPSHSPARDLQKPTPPPQPTGQEYYPPPVHRTLTQTARIPQKLERIVPRQPPRDPADGQETGVVRDALPQSVAHARPQVSTKNEPDYRSFAERRRGDSRADPFADPVSTASQGPATKSTIRPIVTEQYESSPDNYASPGLSAATQPTPSTMRFYERVNKESTAPEGYI